MRQEYAPRLLPAEQDIGAATSPGVFRAAGRSIRRASRTGASGLIAIRARLCAVHYRRQLRGRACTIDHGYLVPSRVIENLDHHQHQVELIDQIWAAAQAANADVCEIPTGWRHRRVLEIVGDPGAFWRALGRAVTDGAALSVQLARPTSATATKARRAVRWLVGAEFAEAEFRLEGWGRPLSFGGSAPTADAWLVAGHASTPDGRRHLGLDDAIELRFGQRSTVEPSRASVAVDFPIDAVFTWVDFEDPRWQREFAEASRPDNLVRAAATESRFNHVNELRYSLRSVDEFAPWINHIWLVTAGHVPSWLDRSSDRISVITHEEIWAGEEGLPTFNSQAIEANLHRIPGLTEHFLYFNDDMLIGRPVAPETFFTADGRPRVFVSSSDVPDGVPCSRDLAPDAAGKNNRRLVAKATGQVRSSKYQHAPYALRGSIMGQLEQHFGVELSATRRSRFRSTSDVTAAGGLHHSFALATRQAVVGDIRHRYVDLESPEADHLLDGIARYRYYESFCVNVVLSGPRDPAGLVRFLQGYYPNPAPWEVCLGQG